MEFLQDHWGDLFSLLGVLVSLIGLMWAVREARGARSAAEAAHRATRETGDRIGRHLVVVDLERSIALIQRLKLLHDTARWEAALEQYQALRVMLSAIIARYPETEPDRRRRLRNDRNLITIMENSVQLRLARRTLIDDSASLSRQLNGIQANLEDMAMTIGVDHE